MFKYQNLKGLVDELEKYEQVTDIKVDLVSIIFETLNYLKNIINVKQLDSKITALKSMNVQSLIELLEEIKKLDLNDVVVTISEKVEKKFNVLYDELESFVSAIVEKAPLLESTASCGLKWMQDANPIVEAMDSIATRRKPLTVFFTPIFS
ncbi:hypothetical protein ACFLTP_09715 [Chloroflexota bacterium]